MTISLAFGLFAAMSVSASDAGVYVIGTSGQIGNLVDVRISLSGNEELESLELNLIYDSTALLMYKVEDTGVLNGAFHGYNSDAESFQLCWQEGGTAKGTVAVITFLITEASEEKSYSIKVSDGDEVLAEGFVNVMCNTPGDVNDDGNTDMEDSLYISEYAVGNGSASSIVDEGDINGDGKINLLDAMIIARYAADYEGFVIDGEREEIEEAPMVENDGDEENF